MAPAPSTLRAVWFRGFVDFELDPRSLSLGTGAGAKNRRDRSSIRSLLLVERVFTFVPLPFRLRRWKPNDINRPAALTFVMCLFKFNLHTAFS